MGDRTCQNTPDTSQYMAICMTTRNDFPQHNAWVRLDNCEDFKISVRIIQSTHRTLQRFDNQMATPGKKKV